MVVVVSVGVVVVVSVDVVEMSVGVVVEISVCGGSGGSVVVKVSIFVVLEA